MKKKYVIEYDEEERLFHDKIGMLWVTALVLYLWRRYWK